MQTPNELQQTKSQLLAKDKLQIIRALKANGANVPYAMALSNIRKLQMNDGGDKGKGKTKPNSTTPPKGKPIGPAPVKKTFGDIALDYAAEGLRTVSPLAPLPMNVKALAAHKVTGSTKLPLSNANDYQQRIVLQSVANAIKRTGKNTGGTEYEDYPSGKTLAKHVNGLNVPLPNMALGTLFSNEFNAATTFGRVSYAYDPKTDEVKIYDTYDFSKSPKTDSVYGNIRASANSDKKGDPELIGTYKLSDLDEELTFMNSTGALTNLIDMDYKTIAELGDKVYKTASETGDAATKALGELKESIEGLTDEGFEYLKSLMP